MIWAVYIGCTLAILYSGSRLSIYADELAEQSGIQHNWVGAIVVAAVTSLPEFLTGIGAVTYAFNPDIAAGNALGSCVTNLAILGGLLLFFPPKNPAILGAPSSRFYLTTALVGYLLFIAASLGVGQLMVIGHVHLVSILFALGYIFVVRSTSLADQNQVSDGAKMQVPKRTLTLFFAHSTVVVAAGASMPEIGLAIVQQTSLDGTFVGSILIAISTSLPELVVSISAVRIGAWEIAAGNVFGSNIFNLFTLSADDVLLTAGTLNQYIAPAHYFSAALAGFMSLFVLVATRGHLSQYAQRVVGAVLISLYAGYVVLLPYL